MFGAGDGEAALANSVIYLEAVGQIVVAWTWVGQLPALNGRNSDLSCGKGEAGRHLFRHRFAQTAAPLGHLDGPAAVLGAALGFGAQRIVQDLLSGFFVITEKQYGFGDLVEVTVNGGGEARGTVEDVTLRVTKLRTSDGEVFTVPNGQIVKSPNLSKDWARAVVDIPVPATADINRVNEVLRDVTTTASRVDDLPDLLLDEPQLMGVESIEKDTVKLRMVARTLAGKQFDVGRRF